MANNQREVRELWAYTEWGGVDKVKAYSCAPENPTMWWAPSAGYSGELGRSIFETEREAVEKAMDEQNKKQIEASIAYRKLIARLVEISSP